MVPQFYSAVNPIEHLSVPTVSNSTNSLSLHSFLSLPGYARRVPYSMKMCLPTTKSNSITWSVLQLGTCIPIYIQTARIGTVWLKHDRVFIFDGLKTKSQHRFLPEVYLFQRPIFRYV